MIMNCTDGNGLSFIFAGNYSSRIISGWNNALRFAELMMQLGFERLLYTL
jgi:hypothetical protein